LLHSQKSAIGLSGLIRGRLARKGVWQNDKGHCFRFHFRFLDVSSGSGQTTVIPGSACVPRAVFGVPPNTIQATCWASVAHAETNPQEVVRPRSGARDAPHGDRDGRAPQPFWICAVIHRKRRGTPSVECLILLAPAAGKLAFVTVLSRHMWLCRSSRPDPCGYGRSSLRATSQNSSPQQCP
jgi:hypothetical protein